MLRGKGVSPRVVHLPLLRPFPREAVRAILADGAPVLAVEEHVAAGGLGQELGALLAGDGMTNRFRMLSVPSAFPDACLSRNAALAWAGIDAATIARRFDELVART